MLAGGFLGTGLVGRGSVVGLANASCTGPRACTSTPAGAAGGGGGASWASAGRAHRSRAGTALRRCVSILGNVSRRRGDGEGGASRWHAFIPRRVRRVHGDLRGRRAVA